MPRCCVAGCEHYDSSLTRTRTLPWQSGMNRRAVMRPGELRLRLCFFFLVSALDVEALALERVVVAVAKTDELVRASVHGEEPELRRALRLRLVRRRRALRRGHITRQRGRRCLRDVRRTALARVLLRLVLAPVRARRQRHDERDEDAHRDDAVAHASVHLVPLWKMTVHEVMREAGGARVSPERPVTWRRSRRGRGEVVRRNAGSSVGDG